MITEIKKPSGELEPEKSSSKPPRRKQVVGVVKKCKMQKTVVVEVSRRVKHGMYKKYVLRSRSFLVHDEKSIAKVGDEVSIVESRPISRNKRWALQSVLRRVGQVLELSK